MNRGGREEKKYKGDGLNSWFIYRLASSLLGHVLMQDCYFSWFGGGTDGVKSLDRVIGFIAEVLTQEPLTLELNTRWVE